MVETSLKIRGMVCSRCIQTINDELEILGLTVIDTRLGQVTIQGPLNMDQRQQIDQVFEQNGFSLLIERKDALVDGIKELVTRIFTREDLGNAKIRFSDLIQDAYPLDYATLSALFMKREGKTLEKYIIDRRLDRVKELLVYTDLTLSGIAYYSGFSSAQHLSTQFKHLTGLTPSFFRNIRHDKQALTQSSIMT